MNCYMCGNPATRRVTSDLDIEGIPLCNGNTCKMLLDVELMTADDGVMKRLDQHRKHLHKENGNKMPKQ